MNALVRAIPANALLLPASRHAMIVRVASDPSTCRKCGGDVRDDGPRAGDGLRVRRCLGPCRTVEGYSEIAYAVAGASGALHVAVVEER